MSKNQVIFSFTGQAADQNIGFAVTDSRIKKNKAINSDNISVSGAKGKLTITVDVSRSGNEDVANWYKDFVREDTHHMVHTASGSNSPDKLNFAVKGTLIIGDQGYEICIGQGHYVTTNNWHMAGKAISARANNKSAYLDNIYFITTSGSSQFNIADANTISTGKGFDLWTSTNTEALTPRFDLEGDALHPFPYHTSPLPGVGTMQNGYAFDTTGTLPTHRDFHLQLLSPYNGQYQNVLYKLNRITGAITGNELLRQTAIQFEVNNKPCMMNYGVSHAALPLGNQSYIYAGQYDTQWMTTLAKQHPDFQFKDLVLSGSHDAGMYEININDPKVAIQKMIAGNPALAALELAGTQVGEQLLANLALTQKDDAYTQLVAGTRYFDFRPAYRGKSFSMSQTFHLHNFIPGALFTSFLRDVDKFLQEHSSEFAIVRIAKSGIDTNTFTPLSQEEVEQCLAASISDSVGYQVTNSLDSYRELTLNQVAKGKRLILLYGAHNVNDSYNGDDYSHSLNNPSAVIAALDKTVRKTGDYQYTVLQLQNTGSSALKHYVTQILSHITAWTNDLVFSGTGNLLQATKPIFDHATYTWLTQPHIVKAIAEQHGPVIIQNDFVEIALYQHALALSQQRYAQRIDKKNKALAEA
ncbi:MAG: flagellin [Gammaproteobacteria bacterium]|nr:flagellin [Gammaproteobacteria bacterium]MBU2057125.1 flagellin [Gammaproteobacteria bacterium]MBU2175023.1 flagellin [Gammaproteobacteria bacterium]MBU2246213.1 flagellin [Gammaproteobacteria bacterium]MBU2344603.1 flagellin [Gammaproteobacteria bacterium]